MPLPTYLSTWPSSSVATIWKTAKDARGGRQDDGRLPNSSAASASPSPSPSPASARVASSGKPHVSPLPSLFPGTPNPRSAEILCPCPFPSSPCLAVVTNGLTGRSCTRGCLPFPPSPSVSRGRHEPVPPPPLLLAAGHSGDQMAHRAAHQTRLDPLYRTVPSNSSNLFRNSGLHGFDIADII